MAGVCAISLGVPSLARTQPAVLLLPSPAPQASQTGNLVVGEDGLYVSWLEKQGSGHALRFARWDGQAFSKPRSIHTSDAFFANWADFPSMLQLEDGSLVAHWLEKAATGTYEYDIWMARSTDGGDTWSEPERPHRDGTLSEHGFVSLVRFGASGFAAAWLDGREFRANADDNEMTLRFTAWQDGQFQEEHLLDDRVCECCQTDMARTRDGLIVVYRNRSPAEIRDIGVVRYVNGAWTAPTVLHDDGWHIAGCPVNGPQVAAVGDRVVVAWFTAAGDQPKVQLIFSDDGGATFGEPTRIDDGQPVGRVDVVAFGDATLVSWLERGVSGRAELRLARVTRSGAAGTTTTIAETGMARASGFPRLAVLDGHVYVTWTETFAGDRPSRVQVARVPME